MDGIVLDTEKLYTHFWVKAAQSLGFPMTHEMGLGMRSLSSVAGEKQLKQYLGETVNYHDVRNKRIELMNAYIESNGVEPKDGIYELLAVIREKQLKCAIATSSPLERAQKHLGSVNLADAFDEIVSGHMVKEGKPKPDIYLYAAKLLDLKPEECLVLEDSPTGMKAAYEAGCIPVMIPDQDTPTEETKKIIYAIVDNLRTVEALLNQMK